MNIVNLTPHALNILKKNGQLRTVEPSGSVVRLKEETEDHGFLDDIEVTAKYYSSIQGLPEMQEDTIYVVSGIAGTTIWELLPERKDVFIPGPALRNEDGKHIGCKGLCCKPNK